MIDMDKFSLIQHDQEIQKLIKTTDQKVLARWAINCLNRILYIYQDRYPDENAPTAALNILNDWLNDKVTMWEARKYCWTVQAKAREIEKVDKVSCQILRATSHTLATCHVKTHAEGSAMYVISALKYLYKDLDQKELIEKLESERKWQINNLKELKNKNQ